MGMGASTGHHPTLLPHGTGGTCPILAMGPPQGRAGDSQDAFMGSWVVTARQDGAQALGVPGPHPAPSPQQRGAARQRVWEREGLSRECQCG